MADLRAVLSVAKRLDDLLKEREAVTGLRGLQRFKPIDYLAEAARKIGGVGEDSALVVAAPRQVREVGEWYASAPELDLSPETKAVYRMMADETGRQFDLLTAPVSKGGLGVDVNITDVDPYAVHTKEGLAQLVNDLENRKISALSTKTTGGHPLFTNDENDQFRLVHDAFGHGATGRGFDAHGEEAAYRSHALMYPEEARRAVASETRAQNAFVNNFGRFSDQKLVLLPEEMAALNAYDLPEELRQKIILNALARMSQ
jgi:hypothetical protein